jgi:hypothetical protein
MRACGPETHGVGMRHQHLDQIEAVYRDEYPYPVGLEDDETDDSVSHTVWGPGGGAPRLFVVGSET